MSKKKGGVDGTRTRGLCRDRTFHYQFIALQRVTRVAISASVYKGPNQLTIAPLIPARRCILALR